jgi:hypothetical protein
LSAEGAVAAGDEAAHRADEAFRQFCVPALKAEDQAALAASMGARQPASIDPAHQAFIDRVSRGTYYTLPLTKGTLLFQAKLDEHSSSTFLFHEKRVDHWVVCNIMLFDVEGNAAGEAIASTLTEMGYRIASENPGTGMKSLLFRKGASTIRVAWSLKLDPTTRIQLTVLAKQRYGNSDG